MKVRLALFIALVAAAPLWKLEASSCPVNVFHQLHLFFSNEGRIDPSERIPSKLPQKPKSSDLAQNSPPPEKEPPKREREADSVEFSEQSRLAPQLESYLSPSEIQAFFSGSRQQHAKLLQEFANQIVEHEHDFSTGDHEDREIASHELNKIGDLFLSLAKMGILTEPDFNDVKNLKGVRQSNDQAQEVFIAHFPRSKEISDYFSSQNAND